MEHEKYSVWTDPSGLQPLLVLLQCQGKPEWSGNLAILAITNPQKLTPFGVHFLKNQWSKDVVYRSEGLSDDFLDQNSPVALGVNQKAACQKPPTHSVQSESDVCSERILDLFGAKATLR